MLQTPQGEDTSTLIDNFKVSVQLCPSTVYTAEGQRLNYNYIRQLIQFNGINILQWFNFCKDKKVFKV